MKFGLLALMLCYVVESYAYYEMEHMDFMMTRVFYRHREQFLPCLLS